MVNIFSKEFTILSYDLNPKGQARLTSMANFFQEVAYHHASELGLGYEDMKSRKTTWVLSRMRIHMKRYPVWNDRIKLETWPSGDERLFALRDFRVLDKIVMHGESKVLKQHQVVFSDLDIVGHVNNVKYIEWCIDTATSAENAKKEIRELEINFNHEALFGERIDITAYEHTGEETYFTAKREGDGQEIISARLKRE